MNIEKLEGLIAAPFTPMDNDGNLNTDSVSDYYLLLKKNGVRGAFICGSTGEGVSMTLEEKKQVYKAWADCTVADTDFKVMVFLGGVCLRDCIELAVYAREIGLYAVSFTAPFYFKPNSVQTLADACREIAASVPDMPFYYYHIPVLTGANFSMLSLLAEVKHTIPNFAGVKYTHEDFMDFQSCMNFAGGHFDMLWGRDENMISALVLGAKGAVGSTFNYAAPLYHQLIEAYVKGDNELAATLQQKSIDMIRLLGKYGGISVGKAYMKLLGLDCGTFRAPIKNMDGDSFKQFRNDVEALGFESFRSLMPAEVSSTKKIIA
ncbi:dihydrodipicolinate synthase family protein [Pedobacter sp.]